jgi:dTDP-4-dehydrorhamnose reductase
MKTVLVTGANGLLGRKLVEAAAARFAVAAADLQEGPAAGTAAAPYFRCDVTSVRDVAAALDRARPDAVIHAAAFTDVDGCERLRDESWAVNVDGAANVARACRERGAAMIHLSTDYVFDGTAGPYAETDPPNPLSHYGRGKLESEREVLSAHPGAAVVRTMVLFGFAPGIRENFVTWTVRKLSAGEPVSIVTDQIGHPTLADDLAAAVLLLAEAGVPGLWHAAGSEWINRFDFARRVAAAFGLDASLIRPTTSDAFKQPAPRPLRSGLISDKLRNEFGFTLSDVDGALGKLRGQMETAGAWRSRA